MKVNIFWFWTDKTSYLKMRPVFKLHEWKLFCLTSCVKQVLIHDIKTPNASIYNNRLFGCWYNQIENCGINRKDWTEIMSVKVLQWNRVCFLLWFLPFFFLQPISLQQVHEHVHRVLEGQCRPSSTRHSLLARLPASSRMTQAFLWKDLPLPDDIFRYPPPFGFRGFQHKAEELLKLVNAPSFSLSSTFSIIYSEARFPFIGTFCSYVTA